MRNSDIKDTMRETVRFFDKLKALMMTEDFKESEKLPHFDGPSGIPESAAVRRASMDLTRSLAKLRRSGRAK